MTQRLTVAVGGRCSLDRAALSALASGLPGLHVVALDSDPPPRVLVWDVSAGDLAELAGMRNGAALLAELGLGGRLNFLPEKLPGGEKQRVAIARALINEPTLILADEPTANLDSKIGREIMWLLRNIAREQGRSVVIVSHDQRIKDIADRVLWLEDGQF